MKNIKISQLWTYPIKSLPGVSLKQSQLLAKGLEYDRSWMLVDSENRFISQRQYPQMALISVAIEDYGLRVAYKDMPALIIPWVNTEIEALEPIKVTVWNDECDALHINTAIDNWFSEALEIDCQLVYLPEANQRLVDKNYANNNEQTRFSDGFPLLLISEESLQDLNSRLSSKNEKALSMKSFRPNIVVSGCTAYDEDQWDQFTIKQTIFSVSKPCSRCIITTIDPLTAEKSNSGEPLKTLSLYRKKDNKVYFGQNILFKNNQSELLEVADLLIF
jgi:uncharacterized protein